VASCNWFLLRLTIDITFLHTFDNLPWQVIKGILKKKKKNLSGHLDFFFNYYLSNQIV